MCGIWAHLGKIQQCMHSVLYKSGMKIKNRGPDSTNMIMTEQYMMMFHRLMINDTTPLGDQPFYINEEQTHYYLMCNGEIYNYNELMRNSEYELSKFINSTSDCEVILPLFLYFNKDMHQLCNTLHGEFSFVILEVCKDNITIHLATDPMSVRPMFYSYNNSSITISSLLCGLTHTKDKKYRIDQGTYMSFVLQNDRLTHTPPKIYKQQPVIADVSLRDIKIVLTNAVKCRLMSDRPIGAFLSGGLDSSLVCLLASNELRKYGKVLQTFSIGALDSPDKLWAEKVAAIIKSEHTHVPFDQDDAITYVDDVIKCVETYDITTIRASTPQYMLAKYVSENTDVKVILSGDGSDELLMGYLYNYNAPSEVEAFLDNIKLINNIHLYDGLRTDRTISHHGLEVRLPFLDYNVVQLYMSIKPSLKLPRHNRMEKYILRQAFDCALPYEILFRTKCAFSDGVSNSKSSWYKRLKNKFDTDEIEQHEYTHVPPVSQESLYYRNRFTELFGKESEKIFKYYWMPAWSNTDDPSARTLTLPNYVNNY